MLEYERNIAFKTFLINMKKYRKMWANDTLVLVFTFNLELIRDFSVTEKPDIIVQNTQQ